jgi:hypothetical protein
MSQSSRFLSLGLCTCACALFTSAASAQTEKLLVGQLKGDQTKPKVALGPKGGYLVWQDNSIDKNGMGIGFCRLNPDGSVIPGIGIANIQKVADQENPDIALLSNGNSAIVWQGGKQGAQQVYLRIIGAKPITGDLLANTYFYGFQTDPHVSANTNSMLITWTSYRINGTQPAVYGQFYNNAGVKWGAEIKINAYAKNVCLGGESTSLKNNNYVVGWSAQAVRTSNSVDAYAKIYSPARAVVTSEFRLNTSDNVCSSPTLASSPDGGFVAVWSERNYSNDGKWNTYTRKFSNTGVALTDVLPLNIPENGGGFSSHIKANKDGFIALWTNIGRDGSEEGIYGVQLSTTLQSQGEEFQVNDLTKGRQIHPSLFINNSGIPVAVWSTPKVGSGFDMASKLLQ